MHVCLSARKLENHKAELHQCMLPVTMARSSCGDGVIGLRYVLPVLRMTPSFHIMALWRVVCIPKQR